MAKKWIIEDDHLKTGNVDYHYKLAKDADKVIGGGRWHIDLENNLIIFYGRSTDFGSCRPEDLVQVRRNGNHHRMLKNLQWVFSPESSLEKCLKNYTIIRCDASGRNNK